MTFGLFENGNDIPYHLCARRVGRRMIEEGVAIWNGEHLVAGPSIQVLMEKIEESKVMTGGFYPHVAKSIFSQILADWNLSHRWTVPSYRNNNLLKSSISINRKVGNRTLKCNISIKTNIFFYIKY